MLASEALKILAPFSSLCNKSALSIQYRVLRLSNMSARGCSSFGLMEVILDLPGLEGEIVHVNADALLQILRSAPSDEFKVERKENALSWKCGAAKGSLALVTDQVAIPEISDDFAESEFLTFTSEVSEKLDLGSLGCGSTALRSVGLYGVAIDNRGPKATVCSTDDTTLSRIILGDRFADLDGIATLSPDAMKLLSVTARVDDCKLSLSKTSVRLYSDTVMLELKQVAPLRYDLGEMLGKYQARTSAVDLDREVIQAFVRRAEALSEDRGKATVQISVDNGATHLSFAEGRSTSEQFYLVEGSPDLNVKPISLSTRSLARALAHSEQIVFDYAAQGILVLHGPDDFMFVISGKR